MTGSSDPSHPPITSSAVPNEINEQERQEIVKLFPTLDLTEVLKEYSHLSSEALIGLILSKKDQIPDRPGICVRFMLKACWIASGIANHWPRLLGGSLLDCVITNVTSVIDPAKRCKGALGLKESMECTVCWDSAPVQELCFCDTVSTDPNSSSGNPASQRRLSETHAFCRTCLERHAMAAIEEMPLAKGGLGLRCMVPDCENPITFQEIREFVSSELSLKLEERCAELSVTQAGLSFMERCRNCNCAVELGASPNVMQVFKCPDCKCQFCRLCDEPWQSEHEKVSCEEYAKQQNIERLLEKRLSDAVVHKCPKCKLAFVKYDGCNKVTCRCGATQCYICRANYVAYDHFCSCFQEKSRGNTNGPFKCSKCSKTCLLWESSVPVEKREMDRIRREVKEEKERKARRKSAEKAKRDRSAAGPSTSNAASETKNAKETEKTPEEAKAQPKGRIPFGRLFNR